MRFSTRTTAGSRSASARTPVRVREVDVLRGFALLGIFLVNVGMMAGPQVGSGGELAVSRVDEVTGWLVTALLGTKFYLLFSFLFGYSFTLQRAAADRARTAFAPRHLRRLVCLFLMGLAHGVLLFPGDVLMTYAVLGLLLFAVRDIAPRTALRAAACLVAGVAACLLAWGLLTVAFAQPVPEPEIAVRAHEAVTAHRGGPGSVVAANLRSLRDTLGWNILYGADMLAAFLVGLAAGRRGLLADPGRRQHVRMKRVVAHGMPVGLAGSVFMALCHNGPLDARWYDIGSAVGILTAPALTASYACGLLLLVNGPRGDRWGAVLAPAGRLALTNYLTQSLVMALVLTGYGLAWYGRFGTTALLAGALLLYGVQLAVSAVLVRRFRYGPAEWLLRAATLARRPGRML